MDSSDNFIETIAKKKRGRPKKQTDSSDDASPFGVTTYPGPFPDHFITMTDDQVAETYEEYGIELPTPLRVFDDPADEETIDAIAATAGDRRAKLAVHAIRTWVDGLKRNELVTELERVSRKSVEAGVIRYAKRGQLESELAGLLYAKFVMERTTKAARPTTKGTHETSQPY